MTCIQKMSFSTLTQYDKIFSNITNKPTMKNKNFCPFFSLLIASNFFKTCEIDNIEYFKALASSIMLHDELNIGNQMSFDELVKYTTTSPNNIQGTTTELLKNKEYDYEEIFPTNNKPYAVIILKNGKYITILHNEKMYHIRDCHESEQYSFLTWNELIYKMNMMYQFDKIINIDGYIISEYSNIEYLYFDIDKPCNLKIIKEKNDLSIENKFKIKLVELI